MRQSTIHIDEAIDEVIRCHVKTHWQKVAMVIGLAMMEGENTVGTKDDLYYIERIQRMVATGRIEVRGDIMQTRFSEIRLASEVS